MEALVYPIGHLFGPFHTDAGRPPAYHRVRIGAVVYRLTDEEVGTWLLAHGVPDDRAGRRWTRSAIGQAAAETGHPGLDTPLDELFRIGVLAEVVPGTAEAIEFAHRYRLRSLLLGLGADPEHPGTMTLGLLDAPVVSVDLFTYEFWQWAPQAGSLWSACETTADVERAERGDTTTPADVLWRVLPMLQLLLGHGAGYLDSA